MMLLNHPSKLFREGMILIKLVITVSVHPLGSSQMKGHVVQYGEAMAEYRR